MSLHDMGCHGWLKALSRQAVKTRQLECDPDVITGNNTPDSTQYLVRPENKVLQFI